MTMTASRFGTIRNVLNELRASYFSQGTKGWREADTKMTHFPINLRWTREDLARDSGSRAQDTAIKLVTWNVDFMAANASMRMSTILHHIQSDVFRSSSEDSPGSCCILLQEVKPDSFIEILKNVWVRKHFFVVSPKANARPFPRYGNVTLVPQAVPLLSTQLLQFGNSRMGRHAIVVDLGLNALGTPESSEDEGRNGAAVDSPITLRVANVHLESLPEGTSTRPGQLMDTAELLRAKDIHAGVVAGDMNVIMPGDRVIHKAASLADAWTGGDDDSQAFTWGYQPPRRFPCRRLDKILHTPGGRCAVDEPQRIGVGLKTSEGQWASDHYGLMTIVRVLSSAWT